MRRREFITLLGSAAAAWPLGARAQQWPIPVIGILSGDSPSELTDRLQALRQGLREAGFVEGQNVAFELPPAEGRRGQLSLLAAHLVRSRVALIVAFSGVAAQTAEAATDIIPIVFQMGGDPIALGLATSLNRPGGNATGVASLGAELAPKKLALLHELVPAATVVAFLVDPTNPSAENQSKEIQAAAAGLGLQLHVLHASLEPDLDAAFATMAQLRVGGLVIASDGFFVSNAARLGELSGRHRIPAVFQRREFAAGGGLMSYGGTLTAQWRLLGVYGGRILKGEKPGDLPIQQSTTVELIINLKTAKLLGVTVPLPLLAAADELIE
jgi:putative tryptophan/tyrosine transport system substrate-binding protein